MPAPKNIPIDIEWLAARSWWDDVSRSNQEDCWLWNKSSGSHGYGQSWDGKRNVLAHRIAWCLEHMKQIPGDMTIDHICRVRRCCNPSHLRLLSNLDNARDNGNATKTHCPHGHEYSKENTYIQPSNNSRRCRTCGLKGNRK